VDKKIENLIAFCQGIYNKENGKMLYEKYLKEIESITPQELFLIENEQLKMGMTTAQMLTFVDKLVNVFHKSLSSYSWDRPKEKGFLYFLMEENKALLKMLDDFKDIIKSKNIVENRGKIYDFVIMLYEYNEHLLKLENILFPYMEKKMERYEGLKIMWSLHDDTRKDLKRAIKMLEDKKTSDKEINIAIGQIYFKLNGLVQKQELIMFPAATKIILEEEFEAMHLQSFDFGFPFIEKPDKLKISLKKLVISNDIDDKAVFKTETGNLTYKQVELLINTLPVDVTFVDENDKVAFFSRPKDRIFPRSAAVIGRDVRNCHPPESVHVVEEIMDSFKSGEKNSASFWIKMKGMFILIQYFALKDEKGVYKGTLEVSQEISEIKRLKGEKRLLD
jgi:uncharacterized protein